ncbi:MAG TPA: hypothetical protein VNL18_12455, partial [Gemmatimonadales bacterium]|nr:hypothetical protein [Gemmatimonadales bacterium]
PLDPSGNIVTPASFSVTSGNTNVATVAPTGNRGIDYRATAAGSGQAVIGAAADGMAAYGLLTVNVSAATAVTLWDSVASPASAWLWTIWGTRSNNVWAAGSGGTIYRYNGTSWSLETTVATSQIRAIWGASESDVWAVGGSGGIFHYNGSTWAADPASGVVTTVTLFGVWGSAPNDVWAVGASGVVLHYDGTSWTAVNPAAASGISFWGGVWGSSRDTVFAAGTGGNIIRYDGTSWSLHATIPGSPVLYRLWGASGRDVFVVGSGGTSYRFDGTSWSQITLPSGYTSAHLYGVWGTAANDVYAVGSPTGGVATLLRFNGTSWSPMVSRMPNSAYGLWGTNAGHVWAGGDNGQLRRGVRGGAMSPSQQISFAATSSVTKMNITSNGTTYHFANGGIASLGKLYEYSLAGAFIDSNAVTALDQRSILYRSGTYYLKSYGTNWYTVNAQTGVTSLVHTGGFSDWQSVPVVSQLGTLEIWEFTAGSIRRLNVSTGALIGTVTGLSGGTNAIATDGYYLYTASGTTVYVYSAQAIFNNTAQLVTTFTLPFTAANYSVSFANGMFWNTNGTTWYGYRLNVTP